MKKLLSKVSAHHALPGLALTSVMGIAYVINPLVTLPLAVALFYLGQGYKDEIVRLKAAGVGTSEAELWKQGLRGNFNNSKNIFDWVTPTVVSAGVVVGISYAV